MNYYKQDNRGNTLYYSKIAVEREIARVTQSAIIPANLSDEVFEAFGFYKTDEYIQPEITEHQRQFKLQQLKIERAKLLSQYDWVSTAIHLTDRQKDSIEKWKWIMRNIFRIISDHFLIRFPDAPSLIPPTTNITEELSGVAVEKIKDYKSVDIGWQIFLANWAKMLYTDNKKTVEYLISIYTDESLDEIISSI